MIATIIVFFTTKVGVTHWIRDYSATDNIEVEKFSDDVVMVVVFRQKKVQCLWGLVWNRLDPLVKFFPREMSIWGFYLFTKTITVKLYGRFKNTKYYFLLLLFMTWSRPPDINCVPLLSNYLFSNLLSPTDIDMYKKQINKPPSQLHTLSFLITSENFRQSLQNYR